MTICPKNIFFNGFPFFQRFNLMKDFGQKGQKYIKIFFCLKTEIAPISPIIFCHRHWFLFKKFNS